MYLTAGEKLTLEISGASVVVRSKLGDGAQGVVYRIVSDSPARGRKVPPELEQAIKWYNPDRATPQQLAALRALVSKGPPRGKAGMRFVWPNDVATRGRGEFGYTMPLIDKKRFCDSDAVWAHERRAPGYSALCEISYQAANSFRALHLDGYCYRDISHRNILFDSETGDICICDNDNVGIDGQSDFQIVPIRLPAVDSPSEPAGARVWRALAGEWTPTALASRSRVLGEPPNPTG